MSKKKAVRKTKAAPPSPPPPSPKIEQKSLPSVDKYDLYERCAQNPSRDARMLRAIHGGDPKILAEDFSGTGAISREWVTLFPGAKAITVDHDPEPLARVRGVKGIRVHCADVMKAKDPADVLAVLNFSIGEIGERPALVKYLKHVHSRLRRGGVMVMDIYAGFDAYLTGTIGDAVTMPDGTRVRYEWEQRHADALTGRVVNAMHFVVRPPGSKGRGTRLTDAFVYHWRLWSIPELRDAMEQAGFGETEIFPRFADATDAEGNLYVGAVQDPRELGDSFSAYVVGRK